MRICQLELKGFRGINRGTVVFPEHSVLLGPNNVGKTTITEALAILFGRERMSRPICDWDFFGGSPNPESRFNIIATLTDFSSNDPVSVPNWFAGESGGVPVWWNDAERSISFDTDAPEGTSLAVQLAIMGRYDDEGCEFELIRYFYQGESDPFTDGYNPVPSRLLRDVGFFLLSSNRDWDKLLSFRSSSFLKVVREYNALPGKAIEVLKEQLREKVERVEEETPLSEILESATQELQSFLLIEGTSKIVYRPTSLDASSVLQSLVAHIMDSDGGILPVSRQGAGMISLQAFLLLLAFAENRRKKGQNFILAAEEPELHLHPSLHQRLANRIRAASVQSIVTTQSPKVAAAYQPVEVLHISKDGGNIHANPLRTEPIRAISSNSVRKLYVIQRPAFYEALMGSAILVPEGAYDYEWLSLWQRAAQASPESSSTLRPVTIIPTFDSIVETYQEVARIRPDAVPIIDGDEAGDSYIKQLLSDEPRPQTLIQLGQNAAVECLSAWILEPSLSNPFKGIKDLLNSTDFSLKTLQDTLIKRKKDRELHENLVWEALTDDECRKRACELLHDIAAITFGEQPAGKGWETFQEDNGVRRFVATHIRRV